MSISQKLYPTEEFYLYEEEVLGNPNNLKSWWRYLMALPSTMRSIIYERALKALPGSYKLWHTYLRHRLDMVKDLPITHSEYERLNNTFERALATMHKMPRIWIMFLQSLTHQRLITRTRLAFDRALRALPITHHDSIWEHYLAFVSQKFVPLRTRVSVYDRFLKYDPSYIENVIEFLVDSEMWKEAAERMVEALNDDEFVSTKGKTKHIMWLELCDLLVQHATEISGLDVDGVIRGGIQKFTYDVGMLWTCLADYYIKRGLLDKAIDVYEEGMMTVTTVRDYSLVFDAYSQFEESVLSIKIKMAQDHDIDDGNCFWFKDDDGNCFWFKDDDDVEMRLERYGDLVDRNSELFNCVQLKQNPHNVKVWHERVRLFKANPTKQVLTYTEAVRTVDPIKAVGKPHTLWVGFANLYETHGDVSNARAIFDKAVHADYKSVDDLACIWCEWAEMELRHNNFKGALQLMQRATCEPSPEIKRRVTAQGNKSVQLYKSLKIWALYADLEECLGTLESTCAVYERMFDLRIVTPQIVLNYGLLLQENNYFENSFKVYERGIEIFKYPHVKDIWAVYLSSFVKRYGNSKLERTRELFEKAVEEAPAESVKALYLQYAKMEEDYGVAKRAMQVYDKATKAVPRNQKLGMYEIFIARAADIFGLPKTREIYEQAINDPGLPDKDVKALCLRYAQVEKKLGEIDRGRALYKHASQFADPRCDHEFWNEWKEFEVQHGNEDTFREMRRIEKSVSASYSQLVLPEYLMKSLDEALTTKDSSGRGLEGFVSGGLQHNGGEDIELPQQDDDVEEEEIAAVPNANAVFGGLVRKRDESTDTQNVGALERIKQMRL